MTSSVSERFRSDEHGWALASETDAGGIGTLVTVGGPDPDAVLAGFARRGLDDVLPLSEGEEERDQSPRGTRHA
jgi:hypothetical protein